MESCNFGGIELLFYLSLGITTDDWKDLLLRKFHKFAE